MREGRQTRKFKIQFLFQVTGSNIVEKIEESLDYFTNMSNDLLKAIVRQEKQVSGRGRGRNNYSRNNCVVLCSFLA